MKSGFKKFFVAILLLCMCSLTVCTSSFGIKAAACSYRLSALAANDAAINTSEAERTYSHEAKDPNRMEINYDLDYGDCKIVDGDVSDVIEKLALTGADIRPEDFTVDRVLDVAFGKVYKLKQFFLGTEVVGCGLSIATDKQGNVLSVSGNPAKIPELSQSDFGEADIEKIIEENDDARSVRKVVFSLDGTSPQYAYDVITGDERIFVSAENGETLAVAGLASPYGVPTEQTDAMGNTVNIEAEFQEGTYYLSDYTRNIFTYDFNTEEPISSVNGVFTDAHAVSAFYNTVKAYDFYTDENIGTTLHGINDGNDDQAGNWQYAFGEIPICIYVHYYDMYYGPPYENAAFGYIPEEGMAVMYVGDGAKTGTLYMLGRALDIIGHEYQHGVTQFAADFVYMNDAGALNEGFSDIFGALIEGHDLDDELFWTIGENGMAPGNKSVLRSIKYPTGTQKINADNRVPACRRNHNHVLCDYGGVHDNSTIVSHVQYKLWKAMPEFFTKEVIGTLWYTTLCMLESYSTFEDFAQAFMQAAQNLGYNENVRNAIYDCLYSSGLIDDGESHVVTFRDAKDNIIEELTVKHGGSVTFDAVITKESSYQYDYEFIGWKEKLTDITRSFDVHPVFSETLRHYTVTFLDYQNNVIKTESVPYGGAATPPEIPLTFSLGEYDYDFSYWSGGIGYIVSDTILTPVYNKIQCFELPFYADGELVFNQRVRQKQNTVLPKPPEKEGYEFQGWYVDENLTQKADPAFVDTDTALYAKYELAPEVEKDAAGNSKFTTAVIIATVCACVVVIAGAAVFVTLYLKKKKAQ